jgi:hypothetical protein
MGDKRLRSRPWSRFKLALGNKNERPERAKPTATVVNTSPSYAPVRPFKGGSAKSDDVMDATTFLATQEQRATCDTRVGQGAVGREASNLARQGMQMRSDHTTCLQSVGAHVWLAFESAFSSTAPRMGTRLTRACCPLGPPDDDGDGPEDEPMSAGGRQVGDSRPALIWRRHSAPSTTSLRMIRGCRRLEYGRQLPRTTSRPMLLVVRLVRRRCAQIAGADLQGPAWDLPLSQAPVS